jgi:pheromone shutdown protein TraB
MIMFILNYFSSFSFFLISFLSFVALLSRVFLCAILADRNVVLANNILSECSRVQKKQGKGKKGGEVVVAVLGMAHCNGVKKLLLENALKKGGVVRV